jgi:hypothetical protein
MDESQGLSGAGMGKAIVLSTGNVTRGGHSRFFW